jgi:hypothetical protein
MVSQSNAIDIDSYEIAQTPEKRQSMGMIVLIACSVGMFAFLGGSVGTQLFADMLASFPQPTR